MSRTPWQAALLSILALAQAHAAEPASSFGHYEPCHLPGEGVSFTSAPLHAALEVTGSAVATLQISADRGDANVFAYLEDVSPDGKLHVITEGRLKASLRKTSQPPFRVPGTPGIAAMPLTRNRSNPVES